VNSFIKKTIKNIFFSERLRIIEEKKKLYSEITENEKITEYQLSQLNKVWHDAYTNLPFYRDWKEKHSLPDKIESIEQLKNFPVLTKRDIYENQEYIKEGLTDFYMTSTGGTSGITTHFPTSKNDADHTYANAYLGRSWWDIQPLNRILMFWGHSHLFGKGLKRHVKQFKRKLSDLLINTKKVSSYALNQHNVANFYDTIVKDDPEVIISYTSNLFQICKYMESKGVKYKSDNFKGIILTSETATDADVAILKERFNTNIIHEYGMAETGAMAYSDKETDNIRILWDSFICTVDESSTLHLTTILPKVFPLFNYTSEDLVEVRDVFDESIISLRFIKGKERDIVWVKDLNNEKMVISTIFLDHVLKFYPNIYSVHYKQAEEGTVTIGLTSDVELDINDLNKYFAKEAGKEFDNLDYSKFTIRQVDNIGKTVAGKKKTFME